MVPETDDKMAMQARLTTISVTMHALLERLLMRGALGPEDFVAMRALGLQLADDIRCTGAAKHHLTGERLKADVLAFWDVVGVPSDTAARAH